MLTLEPRFEDDIQRSHVTVYPLIVIDETYFISTIKESIKNVGIPLNFKDYGLKISNIKESIDINKHTFKISNVTLTLNNYKQDGVRLSDILSNMINKEVRIYYKTQSCKTLEDCLLAYKGIIKRNSHDESTVRITLEDLSDITFGKNVPVANLGYSKNTYSEDYINKPIPIAYGVIEKAPVIPWIDEDGASGKMNLSIIADDVEEVTGSGRNISIHNFANDKNIPELHFETGNNLESYLYIYKDSYLRVLQDYNQDVTFDLSYQIYNETHQYSIDSSGQYLSINKLFTGINAQNPPALNEFQTVTLVRPNQAELLISESGEVEQGYIGSAINIEPFSGILRPQASVDSEEKSTIFLDTGVSSEFDTFSQIPNSQGYIDNLIVQDGDLIVNKFRPSALTTGGIFYPTTARAYTTNYLWLINAWIQSNAHHLNVKFINAPSGDMIITKADVQFMNDGYRLSGEGQVFKCYTAGGNREVKIFLQYDLNSNFKSAYTSACLGFEGDEDFDPFPNGTFFPQSGNNLHGLFGNPSRQPFYPTTVYKIDCFVSNSNNLQGISTVYVGQWDETTMSGALEDDEVWYNLFYDPICDDLDITWLFDSNDFATFTPFDLVLKTNLYDDRIKSEYKAKYNGVGIGFFNRPNGAYEPFNEGSSRISSNKFGGQYGGYGFVDVNSLVAAHTTESNTISMDGLCNHSAEFTSDGSSGGASWWMLIDEEIGTEKTLKSLSSDEAYFGEFIDTSCNTIVKKGCLIPCANKYKYFLSGRHFSYNFTETLNINTVTLTTGNAAAPLFAIPERRLSLLFPMPDISNTDAMTGETNTFVYGSLNINVPSLADGNHITDGQDTLLVQAYAADIIEEDDQDLGGLNYNAVFVGSSNWGTNLISLAGNSDTFVSGGSQSWDINNYNSDGEITIENENFTNITDFRIRDWNSPDGASALALAIRMRNADGDTNQTVDDIDSTRKMSISADIYSIAVLQYSVYSNVFKTPLFADIKGRADENGKYTNETSSVVENPADVLYHFVEKELSVIDKTDRNSWELARSINSNIKLAFSITEDIKSKELIQNIAKSTQLFPKFNSSGDFSFSSINDTYTEPNVQIKQRDIIKFEFTRTPSENIHTLVNVKYKKDYADGSYKKQTGYCDGYDFFGNGENGLEVYKTHEGISSWYPNQNSETGVSGYNYNFLGLKREDNILEFKSDFIRDYASAVHLRNYIYLLNCNQHTIVKCTLPLKYIKLEVGDVIEFDELHNSIKSFGEDYTKEVYRNGQKIYPYFILTSVTKSSKDIKLECMQLHELSGNFTAGQGSLSRRSELGAFAYETEFDVTSNFSNAHITYADLNIYEDIIADINDNYRTSMQKLSADLNGDGSIDQLDLNILTTILNGTNAELGDINMDGSINIYDIISLTEYIIEQDNLTLLELLASDVSQDGVVNVADLVRLVELILENSGN